MKDRILAIGKSIGYRIITSDAISTGAALTMAEQFSRRDFLKLASVSSAVTAILSACGRLPLTRPNQPTTKEPFLATPGVDITKLYPEKSLFGGEAFGRIELLEELNIDELTSYKEMVARSSDIGQLTGELTYDGFKYIDQTGKERSVIIVFTNDPNNTDQSAMYMHSPFSQEDLQFIPADEAESESKGRLFPIIQVDYGTSGISSFGIGKKVEDDKYLMTVELFRVTPKDGGERQVTAFEPYSGTSYIIPNEDDLPEGASKVLASLVSIEKPLPTKGKIAEIVKSLEDTDYGIKWNKDNSGIILTYTNPENESEVIEIEGIVFDEKGEWKRTYEFETPYGTKAEVTIDSRVDKMTIVETPKGKKVLDFSGWNVVDGKWTRETEQGEIQLNVAEAQQIIIENGSENPDDKQSGVQLILDYTNAVFPNQVGRYSGTIKYNKYVGVITGSSSNSRWWGNDIKTLDQNNKQVIIQTTSYVVLNFSNRKSALIYKDKNQEFKIIFIDADLNDWANWSPYF